MSRSLFLIMGSHLFPIGNFSPINHKKILMIEDIDLCKRFCYHKKKLVFFLEAMRNYADTLRKYGFEVTYILLEQNAFQNSFFKCLKEELDRWEYTSFESYEIEDRFFRNKLLDFSKEYKLNWITHKSPMFLHTIDDFTKYFKSQKKPRLSSFYEIERKQRNILMENGKPIGGKLSFDEYNRKPLPKSIVIPDLPVFKPTKHHTSVCTIVNKLFSSHPGDTENIWLPVLQEDARKWLQLFLDKKLTNFGPYQDAVSAEKPFLFHSILSPLLNIGLLTPEEVIKKAIQQIDIPLNSIEGFIRQILGWREFVRGIDEFFGQQQEHSNFFKNKRLLRSTWWTGETGMLPVDHSIQSAIQYGYCNHIQRLMILSNVMLLLEVDPKEVYRWFMEMFIDSAEWVMGPNVYGMGQFSDGGLFATKPYICSSNYIRKMSSFPKGEWCDILDGLYWRFIDKRRAFFSKQPRLNMMIHMLDKIPLQRRDYLFSLAKRFQEKNTINSI